MYLYNQQVSGSAPLFPISLWDYDLLLLFFLAGATIQWTSAPLATQHQRGEIYSPFLVVKNELWP